MVEITEQTLERFQLVLLSQISAGLAEHIATKPELDLSAHPTFYADHIVARVKVEVLGQNLEVIRCEYPTTWWDAFKQRWFPGWAKRRWPVDITVEELHARVFYPQIPIKHHDSVVNLQQMKWRETQDV